MRAGLAALRGAFAALTAFASVILGLMVLGLLVPRPAAVSFPPPGEAAGRHAIYLAANPIHTDILLPATPEVLDRFAFLARDGLDLAHPALGTIVVGWGGRAFYTQTPTWGDLTFDAVWRSATLDRSVLHVALGGRVEGGQPGLVRLDLGDAAFAALLEAVADSFEPGPDGTPPPIPDAAYGAFDHFYEARGPFNLLLGCNTWTAAMLRAAGVRTGLWTPLPPLLLWSLTLHEQTVAP
ncbi:TIGR02117 family protein [uncultured Aureimonas sp.]|uniref:TIGR02117 family protein n=1 Tax=uncultured Aureimonas sp. TaxID=1604662 RepID=UPI0025E87B74|nr:TIGR02117 family protein [uncultured Aureimonas sp.]